MKINNKSLIEGISGVDMTSDIQSGFVFLGHIANFSIQVIFTGSTPNGSLFLQASNDKGFTGINLPNATITNWTDVTTSEQVITASGDHLWNVQDCGYRWVRFIWRDAASTGGTITVAQFNVKGV